MIYYFVWYIMLLAGQHFMNMKNVIKCDLVLSIKIIYYHSNYYIVLWIRIISSHDWICFKIEPTADFLSWIVISTNRTLGDVKHMLSRFISCFRKETQEHNGQAISCRNKAEWKMRVSFVLLRKVMSQHLATAVAGKNVWWLVLKR